MVRYGKDRFGRTPREYVLQRLVAALTDPVCPSLPSDQDEVMEMVLDKTSADTLIVRGIGTAVDFFNVFIKGRRRCRSFSEHLARYLDGLNPVARSRLFAEARRRKGQHDGASDKGAG